MPRFGGANRPWTWKERRPPVGKLEKGRRLDGKVFRVQQAGCGTPFATNRCDGWVWLPPMPMLPGWMQGPISRNRAYALANPMEFFAELSEAFVP